MDNLLVLGAVPIAIWLLLLWLRVPSAALFLSVYVGHLVSIELADELYKYASSFINVPNFSYAQAVLLLLPVVLTVLILRAKSPKSRIFIEAIPVLFAVITLVLFVDEYLNLTNNLTGSQEQVLQTYRSFVVSIGAVLSLVSAWMMLSLKHAGKDKKHH